MTRHPPDHLWATGRLGLWLLCSLCLWTATGGHGWAGETPSRGPQLVPVPLLAVTLEKPTFLTHARDGTGTLYVLEQAGRIRVIRDGTLLPRPFLDVSDRVLSGGERGLLGLAFHPDFRKNGRFFLNYTRKPDGWTVLAEYRRAGDGETARQEEKILLLVPQPFANHNGGMVAFGPDGYLYVGMGDGGSGGDPGNRAQNPQELLGKILRLDIDHGDPYGMPPDNPYVRGGGRPEIYAIGFRNPWRFSFDRATGDLWVADVGQNRWEEINVVRRGGNHGWKLMEGDHCFEPADGCRREGLARPIAEYARQSPRCGIIGGYVYRGATMPSLLGTYLFGDFCSGEILGVSSGGESAGVPAAPRVLRNTLLQPSSFGEDERGEVYLLDHRGGGVYRLAPEKSAATDADQDK